MKLHVLQRYPLTIINILMALGKLGNPFKAYFSHLINDKNNRVYLIKYNTRSHKAIAKINQNHTQ